MGYGSEKSFTLPPDRGEGNDESQVHEMRLRPIFRQVNNERGMVLVVVLLLLSALIILGTTTIMQTSTDLKISGNYKSSVQAFYDADAGVQYAIAKMEEGLKSSPQTFTLSSAGSPATLTYTTPTGFSFTISTIAKNSGSNTYSFTSTGNAPNNAQAAIEATFERGSVINYAAFGDESVDNQGTSSVKSYEHTPGMTLPPTSFTGDGDIGSNGDVTIKSGATIDGDVALGDDGEGTEGTLDNKGTITGEEGTDVARVDPDPLGVVDGEYATNFTTYSTSNDNALATGSGISGTEINIGSGDTATLVGKAGGANYYFTDIVIGSKGTLDIDSDLGPVNIYLAGSLEAKSKSSINVSSVPAEFSIFSNSTDSIVFKHGGDFKGLVYAPYAQVEMKNSADYYGAIWAGTLLMHSSGTIYYDTGMKDKFSSDDLTLTSWKEDRS